MGSDITITTVTHDQILEGSHRCGRVEHGPVGGQVGADLERVEQLKKRLEHHYVEMEPGGFRCQLTHSYPPSHIQDA